MKPSILIILSLLSVLSMAQQADHRPQFDWAKATVYFLITDRFCNGDSSNDINYGRIVDYGSEQLNAATFHGGDFQGLLRKAQEGYFKDMGVDVVWMTDVYEQIHGWMSGSGAVNDFPHYGYYPLDYTQTDKNYGTVEEFRTLIDTLHSQGIRVMLGANLNDPGYPTLLDAVQLGFTDTGLTEKEAAQHIREWNYDVFYETRLNWDGWYGRGWIRMPDEQWDENNPLEATLYGMPDFKDENNDIENIPEFLHRKWEKEGNRNEKWTNPSAAKLRANRDYSPIEYIIAWIASWVDCATSLLLAPGIAQIFYGDETGRKLSDARLNVDSNQAFRSDMNWNKIDSISLMHFQKLGKIRQTHPSIGKGRQVTLDQHTCVRIYMDDLILIAVKPDFVSGISTGGYIENGEKVVDLYSGNEGIVRNGKAFLPSSDNNAVILRQIK